jgi:hypothetical protein
LTTHRRWDISAALTFINEAHMRIKIKDLKVPMKMGSSGVTLDVYDNTGEFLGDLRIGKAKIEWCKGKTRSGNGDTKTWKELIEFFEN